MSNIERIGDNTSALVRTAEAMQGTIDARVASLLPAVVDEDGAVDWDTIRHLPVTMEVGSLVVAKAIPELIFDESRITSRLEASGRIEDALNHRNYVQALQSGSARVLSQINAELFNVEESRDGMTMASKSITDEDGVVRKERVQKASKIMDFSDALLIEMQKIQFGIALDAETDKYVVNPEQLDKFVDELAMPAAKLARDGIDSETAFALIRVQNVTGVEMDDIFDAAEYLSVNVEDQSELSKMAYALARVNSLSDLKQFIDPMTGQFTLIDSDEDKGLDEIDLQTDGIVLPSHEPSEDIDTEELDPDELERHEESEVGGYIDIVPPLEKSLEEAFDEAALEEVDEEDQPISFEELKD